MPKLQRTPPPVCPCEMVVLYSIFAAFMTGEWALISFYLLHEIYVDLNVSMFVWKWKNWKYLCCTIFIFLILNLPCNCLTPMGVLVLNKNYLVCMQYAAILKQKDKSDKFSKFFLDNMGFFCVLFSLVRSVFENFDQNIENR